MVYIPGLPKADRMALASISGLAWRYGIGSDRHRPRHEGVTAIREATQDPRLLGIQAGLRACDHDDYTWPVLALLLAAGADLAVAHQQIDDHIAHRHLHHLPMRDDPHEWLDLIAAPFRVQAAG